MLRGPSHPPGQARREEVTGQQEYPEAHAQRRGQGGRQLPERSAFGGLVETATGEQQHCQRHNRQEQRGRPGSGIEPANVPSRAELERIGNPDAGTEHCQVDGNREPPRQAVSAAQPVSAHQ